MTEIANSIATKQGATVDINIMKGYPVLVNHDETTERVTQFATEYLGEENIIELNERMTSEDFAYFSQAIPSTFYRHILYRQVFLPFLLPGLKEIDPVQLQR